jgi:hypothetical protein
VRLVRCDNCGNEVRDGDAYMTVTMENEHITLGYQGDTKQFDTAKCVAEYYAKQAGLQVI